MVMTAPTPITMPSMVSALRSLFTRSARTAIRALAHALVQTPMPSSSARLRIRSSSADGREPWGPDPDASHLSDERALPRVDLSCVSTGRRFRSSRTDERARVNRQRSVEPSPSQDTIVTAHYGRLRRLCRLMLGDPHEAEDVVQEVFLKAHKAERLCRAPMDWGAWLTRVAVNACRDRRRAGGWMRLSLR